MRVYDSCNLFLKNQHHAITLPLFHQTSTNFWRSSSFIKIPTPLISSLFLDHHSFYLQPLISTNRAPCPRHLTPCLLAPAFCRQCISTFLFFYCLHSSYFFHKNFHHFNFEILPLISVTWRFFAPPPAHLGAARQW